MILPSSWLTMGSISSTPALIFTISKPIDFFGLAVDAIDMLVEPMTIRQIMETETFSTCLIPRALPRQERFNGIDDGMGF